MGTACKKNKKTAMHFPLWVRIAIEVSAYKYLRGGDSRLET